MNEEMNMTEMEHMEHMGAMEDMEHMGHEDHMGEMAQTSVIDSSVQPISAGEFNTALAAIMVPFLIFTFIILAVVIISHWKIFTKAGQAGWKSIVPIYNTYTLLKIIGRPAWWLLLLMIPFVNLIIVIITSIDTAKSFGRSETFGIVGLFIFNLIGYCILAFGGDKYIGPAAAKSSSDPTPEATPDDTVPAI